MSPPQKLLQALQQDVASHQRRIDVLRAEVRQLEEEIELHETVVSLAQNTQLLDAVGELYGDKGTGSDFARDPSGYCRSHNISLPEGVAISPINTDGPNPTITAHVTRGSSGADIVWDREAGFSVHR